MEVQIHIQILHSTQAPRERAKTRLPRPLLKAKISPAQWTVWLRAWDEYSTYSCMEVKGLAVQLWQCLADTTRLEL